MGATATATAEPIDLDQAINGDENRRVRIQFHKDAKHQSWKFTYNGGKGSRPSRPIVLEQGKYLEVDIKRARAWLGWFTIQHDIEGEVDTKKRKEMEQFFDLERVRTLNTFGDYPRPRKVADGMDPIGPHRMPDFVVTVVEGDGERWAPIRLHEMYGVGIFDPLSFVDPQAAVNEELQAERDKNRTLERMIAELTGKINGVVDMVKANAKTVGA